MNILAWKFLNAWLPTTTLTISLQVVILPHGMLIGCSNAISSSWKNWDLRYGRLKRKGSQHVIAWSKAQDLQCHFFLVSRKSTFWPCFTICLPILLEVASIRIQVRFYSRQRSHCTTLSRKIS